MRSTLPAALGNLLLTVFASVVGSLLVVWMISALFGFRFNASLVAMLSAVLSVSVGAPRFLRQRHAAS
jgi:hypothetical protein